MQRAEAVARLRRHAGLVAVVAGVACLIAGVVLYIQWTLPNRTLLYAGRMGDDHTVRALLRAGVDPTWHNEKGQTAVEEAARGGGSADTVFLLLDHGADVGDALGGAVLRPRPTLVRQIFARHPDAATHWHYHVPLRELAQSRGEETLRAVEWGLKRARKAP